MSAPDCYSCRTAAASSPPPREDVLHTDHWRVAHAFNSTLPGWLVVLPTRHLGAFTELTPEAATELGRLVRRLSLALEQVTGCVKTYLMQFSEAEGFSHLHLHLVPRMPDQPDDCAVPASSATSPRTRRGGSPTPPWTRSPSPSARRTTGRSPS